jgi:hypothetical protein
MSKTYWAASVATLTLAVATGLGDLEPWLHRPIAALVYLLVAVAVWVVAREVVAACRRPLAPPSSSQFRHPSSRPMEAGE